MNKKIFKVVWNKVRGDYVVTSEKAGSAMRKKTSANKSISTTNNSLTATLVVSILGTLSTVTFAENSANTAVGDSGKATITGSSGPIAIGSGASASGDGAISIGYKAGAGGYSKANDGITIGRYTQVNGTGAIAIGGSWIDPLELDNKYNKSPFDKVNTIAGRDSIAIGYANDLSNSYQGINMGARSRVKGTGNIVFGSGANESNRQEVRGNKNTVIGNYNKVNELGTVTGSQSGTWDVNGAIANSIIGSNNTLLGRGIEGSDTSTEKNTVLGSNNNLNEGNQNNLVLGSGNTIKAGVKGSYILGGNGDITESHTVYIGDNSVASLEEAEYTAGALGSNGTIIAGKQYTFAGKGEKNNGVITVGKYVTGEGTTGRVIQNLAPGALTEKSTDAINGSQLYSVIDTLNNEFVRKSAIISGSIFPFVYTDENGKKLLRSTDNNFYRQTDIEAKGYKVTSDGQIYKVADVKSDGTPKSTAIAVSVADAVTKKTDDTTNNTMPVEKSSIIISAVNPSQTGEEATINATLVKNVASPLGNGAVFEKDTNTFINTLRNINITESEKLHSAVTLEDLQNLSNSPLFFAGDKGNNFPSKLGEKVNIIGEPTSDLTNGNIGVVSDGQTKSLTVKLAKIVNLTEGGMLIIDNTVMDAGGLSTPEVNADTVTVGKTTIKSGKITGLEERSTEDSNDYGTKNNANRAATESAVKVVNDNVKAVDTKLDTVEFGLKSQDGKEVKKNLNNTIDVVGADDNISTKVDDSKLKIELAKDLKGLNSIEVKGTEPNQRTVINGDTITSTSKDNEVANRTPNKTEFIGGDNDPVILSNNGLDNGGNKITNVADGVDPTDAVNMSQLTGVSDKVNKGLSFAGDYDENGGDDNNKFTQQLGDMTSFEGGADFNDLSENNIGVVSNGADGLAIKLAKNINLTEEGSVQLGDTMINNGGLEIANGPSVTKEGISAAGKPITNVASAIDGKDGADALAKLDVAKNDPQSVKSAVNVSDLANTADALKDSLGNELTNKGFGLTDDDGTAVKKPLGETIKVNGKNGITVKANEATDGLDIGIGDELNVGDKVAINGKNGTIGVKGDNGKDGVALNGKDGSITLNNGKDGENGASAKLDVVNGKPGLNGQDGDTQPRLQVDGKQMATLEDGLLFQGNNKDDEQKPLAKTLNQKLTIKGGNDGANVSDANTYVDNNGSELVVKLAKDLTDIDSISTNGGVKIGNDGIDAGNKPITNVADGKNGNDAVNKNQLDAVSANAESKLADFTVGADKDTNADGIVVNKNNKRFDIVGGDSKSITTKVDGNKVVVDLANDLTAGKLADPNAPDSKGEAGSVTVAGKDGKDGVSIKGNNGKGKPAITIAGENGADGVSLTTKTDGQPDVKGGDAKPRLEVNGEEVATLNDGIKYAGDTGTAATALNKTANIVGGVKAADKLSDNNIGVVASQEGENAKLTVKLAKKLNGLDNISFAPNDSAKPDEKVSIGKGGLNNGGNQITNVASGGDVDTNAANIGDVKKAAAAASSKVAAGDNIVVNEAKNADGSTTYTVATAKDLNVDSVKAGDTTVNNDGVKVGDNVTLNNEGLKAGDVSVTTAGINAGNNKVSGVQNGDISATSTDAVNGSQLFNQGEGVKNIIGGNTTYDPSTGTFTNPDIGGTGKGNINDALASVNTASKAAKTEVTEGKNISVTESKGANGQTIYNVATADKVAFDEVKVGDVAIDNNGINAGNKAIDGVKAGNVAEDSQQAVNGGQLHNTAKSVADALGGGSIVNNNGEVTAPSYELTGTDGKKETVHNVGGALNFFTSQVVKPITFTGNEGSYDAKLGQTVQITGADSNISTKVEGNNVKIRLADNLNVKSVTAGNTKVDNEGVTIKSAKGDVSLTANGLNNGGNRITNVAPGVADSDVATIGQVKGVAQQVNRNTQAINNLGNRMNNMDRKLKGGIAGNSAMASLPQAYIPGHSMVAVAGGHYSGKSAVALGVSRISDSGHVIIKLNAATNSSGGTNVGAGVGYQW